MHPKEVELLRAIYGRRFFLIAVYSDAETRRSNLVESLRSSAGAPATDDTADKREDVADRAAIEADQALSDQLRTQVDELMRRDEGISEPAHHGAVAPKTSRVAIRRTFAEADLFVSPHELQSAREPSSSGIIERSVEKVFDEPFHTPTRDELGIAHAYVAALRSGSLARRVGAAVCTPECDLLAVGVNDVPAPGGGHYWPAYDGGDGEEDQREHLYELPTDLGETFAGVDSNDQTKLELFADLTKRIFEAIDNDVLDPRDQLTLFSSLKTNRNWSWTSCSTTTEFGRRSSST